MVCIDANGCVKVWINGDLSRCSSGDGGYIENMELNEEQMVEEVSRMIEKNTTEEIEVDMTFS